MNAPPRPTARSLDPSIDRPEAERERASPPTALAAPASRAAGTTKPSSPCTKVCVLDGPGGLCIGCGRTRDEIALWGSLSEPRRRAIMAGLPARLREAHLTSAEAPAR